MKKYWLLLEKSDETRVSKGIDAYQDKTGELYHYDSLVPNHKNIATGDSVVLRKENEILGIGEVAQISKSETTKTHRRCPECESTDIRERTTQEPKWKCGKCGHQFPDPMETTAKVTSFVASIDEFQQLTAPPDVKDVKRCAASGDGLSSQLSILELDEAKIRTLLEGINPEPFKRNQPLKISGQGFGLSQPERKAVELHAMHLARSYYEGQGWSILDTSNSHPFDLLATRNQEKRFIEVKGTTGEGLSVVLTHGEVLHAQNNRLESVLVIVSGVILTKHKNEWIASGGKISTHEEPWMINEAKLKAIQYRYEVGLPQ